MSVTSTGAAFRARAARSPPKPPPMITTCFFIALRFAPAVPILVALEADARVIGSARHNGHSCSAFRQEGIDARDPRPIRGTDGKVRARRRIVRWLRHDREGAHGHTRLSAPRACPIAMPSEAAVPLTTLVGAMGGGQ